jgi:hypothetical protein
LEVKLDPDPEEEEEEEEEVAEGSFVSDIAGKRRKAKDLKFWILGCLSLYSFTPCFLSLAERSEQVL